MILEVIGGILICIGLYSGICKLKEAYLFKKYPPGSGHIITTRSTISYQNPKEVKSNIKYFRVLRKWNEEEGRYGYANAGNILWRYCQECETWE